MITFKYKYIMFFIPVLYLLRNYECMTSNCRKISGFLLLVFMQKYVYNNDMENERQLSWYSVGNSWSDGTPVNYTNWEIGQPDSYNGLEACVQINPESGRWTDRDCNEKKKFVCKKRKGK